MDWLIAILGLRFCARALSSYGKWGPLFIALRRPLSISASLVAEHRLQRRRLSSCGSRAQLPRGMGIPPRPELEPVSPALAGRLSTTAPPGKPLEGFYHKWVLNFVESFFCIYWDDHMVFLLLFVNMVYHIDLRVMKNPCIPGINSTWSWCMILLMFCWILCWYFVEDFCIYVHQWYWPVVFFSLWHLCLVLVSGWWWPRRMSLGVFLPLQYFGRVWEG